MFQSQTGSITIPYTRVDMIFNKEFQSQTGSITINKNECVGILQA